MAKATRNKTLVQALHEKYSTDEETDIKVFVRVPKVAPGFSGKLQLLAMTLSPDTTTFICTKAIIFCRFCVDAFGLERYFSETTTCWMQCNGY